MFSPSAGNGAPLATFTYDDNGVPTSVQVGSNPQTAPRYYYVHNGHGDVVTVADASGNVLASYSYDEYGIPLSSSESFPGGWSNPFRYDGRDDVRYDAETSLYWMSVLAYDPTLGRFIARDPLGRAADGLDQPAVRLRRQQSVDKVDPSGQRLAGASGATVRGAVVAHSTTHTYVSHPRIFLSRNVRDAENYSCDASCARRNAQFQQAFSAAEKSVKTQAQAAANQLNQLGDALQACAGASILLGLLATEAWGPFAAFLAGFWVWDLNEWSAEAHQLAGTFQSEAAHDYSWFDAGTIGAMDQQVMGIRDKFLKKDFAFAGQLANIAAAILYWAKKIDLPRAFVAVVNSVVMYLGVLLIFNVGKRNIDEQGYILRSVSP